jgi:hypothetical protein
MTYQTGVAATPTQLLDALRVFAVGNGWSEGRWAAHGTGFQLSLSKNGAFFHLRSAVNESLRVNYLSPVTGIFLTAASGFDAAQPWYNQPGTIRSTAVIPPSVPTGNLEVVGLYEVSTVNTYHLFAATDPDQIVLVVETAPGVFHQLAFGALAKHGNYPGGEFVTGSFGSDGYTYTSTADRLFGYNSDRHGGLPFNDFKTGGLGFVRATLESLDSWFSVCQSAPLTGRRAKSLWEAGVATPNNSLARPWWGYAPNTLNGITPMIPHLLFVERPSGFFSPFGFTPHLRYLNITHYAPGESFVLGAEQWMTFPGHSKNAFSGAHGYAVRMNG